MQKKVFSCLVMTSALLICGCAKKNYFVAVGFVKETQSAFYIDEYNDLIECNNFFAFGKDGNNYSYENYQTKGLICEYNIETKDIDVNFYYTSDLLEIYLVYGVSNPEKYHAKNFTLDVDVGGTEFTFDGSSLNLNTANKLNINFYGILDGYANANETVVVNFYGENNNLLKTESVTSLENLEVNVPNCKYVWVNYEDNSDEAFNLEQEQPYFNYNNEGIINRYYINVVE